MSAAIKVEESYIAYADGTPGTMVMAHQVQWHPKKSGNIIHILVNFVILSKTPYLTKLRKGEVPIKKSHDYEVANVRISIRDIYVCIDGPHLALCWLFFLSGDIKLM